MTSNRCQVCTMWVVDVVRGQRTVGDKVDNWGIEGDKNIKTLVGDLLARETGPGAAWACGPC